ncbi:hypothetical protein [Bifidobacterium goeldii]|nr:hypothetical protein [Bifidobacterium goeldii]
MTRCNGLRDRRRDSKDLTDSDLPAASQRLQAQRLRALRSHDATASDANVSRERASAHTSASAVATAARRNTAAGAANIRTASAPLEPPAPPIVLSPLLACDPNTDPEILWYIARHAPPLRRWLVANPNASAELLEYVAQAGGPGVNHALTILLADP